MRYVEKNGKRYKVIWEPQEGSQALALSCPCNIILLDGSRGPGKTDAQLMFYRKFVGLGYGAFWRGVIFDKEYKNLDDLVSKSKRWFPQFKDGAKFLTSPKDFKWVWPTGEELWFRTLAKETDYWNYHGHEFCMAVGEPVNTIKGPAPVETLKVGDLVQTPTGFKPITRIFDRVKKECVRTSFLDTDMCLISQQLTSAQHQILSSDGRFATPQCGSLISVVLSRPNYPIKRFGYVHPYSGKSVETSLRYDLAFAYSVPAGKHETIDFTVADDNCYVTPSGAINKNCFIGFNELTKHPNLDLYDMTFSLNRSSFVPELHSPVDPETGEMKVLPEIPLINLSTTNPYGVGHNAVKRRFVDPAKPGEIVVIEKEVFNPRTQEREKVRKTQVRLFGSYRENKFLSPQYVLELENIQDVNKRKAWLEGDWDITAGGMFDDIWSSQYNVVPLFNVPPGWRIFRSFDWGSSRPFSVGWWAESNGDDLILPDNSVISTIKGDLFRVREWYGWTGKANTGVKMLSSNITKGIVQREINWGWYGRVGSGPADSSIFTSTSASNIAKEMAKQITLKNGKVYKGVGWLKSDKSPGSRKIGWELMRVAIANAQPNEFGAREAPGLFVTRACQDGFLRTVPGIPRDPDDMDDVDTESEDHVADESRYVILSTGNRFRSGSTIGHA